ncbi:MAG: potassium transporter TrkG [Bacteroidota bacterium]
MGVVLLAVAALALTGLIIALVSGESDAMLGFAVTSGAGGLAGGLLRRSGHTHDAVRSSTAPRVVALAWLLAAVLAALPLWIVGLQASGTPAVEVFADPVNALFESMSGLTSTGLSVAPDASELPRSVQWWRSLIQWVGGIGILYVALVLTFVRNEADHGGELDAEMDVATTGGERRVLWIWGIYAGYTVAAGVAYWAAGMPAWEAVNHSMTTVSTGGFAITGDSFAGYGRAIHAVGVVAMLLGAVSFGVHAAVLLERRAGALRDGQNGLLALLLVLGVLALGLASRSDVAWADTVFHWSSALLTGGLATQDLSTYGTAALLVLVVGMMIGGTTGSTAGGLKIDRLAALLTWTRRPATVRRRALHHLARMIALVGLGTVLLVLLTDSGPVACVFEATSALSTSGLSAGVTGPDLPASARLLLTVLMWMGRLEIAAVLSLVFIRQRATD